MGAVTICSEQTNKNSKLSSNLTLYKAYTNHCTKLRRAETKRKKEFNLESWETGKSLQSCPTLCDPIDGSPPGSPVPGIFQARTLAGLPFPSPMHESEKGK